jgi:hypothetical protein
MTQPVLQQIRRLNQRSLRILTEAEHGKWKDPAIALQAIRECRHNLELIGKLTGELKSPEANAHEPVKSSSNTSISSWSSSTRASQPCHGPTKPSCIKKHFPGRKFRS